MHKIKFLDGIRGFMALIVIVYHFVYIYYPQMYFGEFSDSIGGFLSSFSYTPLSFFVNGFGAATFFFLLSGFLISLNVFKRNTKFSISNIINISTRRYLRLLPIILASTFVTYILLSFGLLFHEQIVYKVMNTDNLLRFCNIPTTFTSFLYNSFIKTFIINNDFIGSFWTIRYEFIGSIFVFTIATLLKNQKYRRFIYIFVLIFSASIHKNILTISLGLVLADFYFYKSDDTTWFSKYYNYIIYSKKFIIFIGIIGIFLYSFPSNPKGFYGYLCTIPFMNQFIWQILGCFLTTFFLLHNNTFTSFFENKCLQFMGKISYVTYSIHWTLMISLQAYLFNTLLNYYSYNISSIVSFLITLPAIYFVSYLGWKYIENKRFDLKLLKLISLPKKN